MRTSNGAHRNVPAKVRLIAVVEGMFHKSHFHFLGTFHIFSKMKESFRTLKNSNWISEGISESEHSGEMISKWNME